MDLETTLREVFDQTEILRRPVNGIVSGYHELPYRIVGPLEGGSVRISGTIRVSPRMVLTFRQLQEQFGKFFDGDDGFMDQELVGRSFQFAVARDASKSIRNEALRIERSDESFDSLLERVHEDLQRAEDTRTGLISCPSPRFYPVSVDRFIREILDRELGPGR
ncbi:MAG: hypothetical protein IPK50_19175 [Fibrobacterota bacterium]|nr:hypothetical protein [Fibrobacterota bacterium]QQS04388.1 MAG: hypothetical protein IPK50_19175 [Fibrobacterota bacterium]